MKSIVSKAGVALLVVNGFGHAHGLQLAPHRFVKHLDGKQNLLQLNSKVVAHQK